MPKVGQPIVKHKPKPARRTKPQPLLSVRLRNSPCEQCDASGNYCTRMLQCPSCKTTFGDWQVDEWEVYDDTCECCQQSKGLIGICPACEEPIKGSYDVFIVCAHDQPLEELFDAKPTSV